MDMRTFIAAFMHQAGRRGGLHVFQVYRRTLGAGAELPASPGLACRRLGEEELLARRADPRLDLGETMVREALLRGDACVGAFCDGELAGYAWFSYDEAPHLDGVRVSVPARAIYRYKAFVLPAYRGRRIAPFLYGAADGIVARPGRECVVNCIAVQNVTSIAASRRSGDALLGHLGYWQAGTRFFALHSRSVAALGLRFYRAS
jgi:GNAT superfamily N-acetyltransferase